MMYLTVEGKKERKRKKKRREISKKEKKAHTFSAKTVLSGCEYQKDVL
jgi:hypothetical protein